MGVISLIGEMRSGTVLFLFFLAVALICGATPVYTIRAVRRSSVDQQVGRVASVERRVLKQSHTQLATQGPDTEYFKSTC